MTVPALVSCLCSIHTERGGKGNQKSIYGYVTQINVLHACKILVL